MATATDGVFEVDGQTDFESTVHGDVTVGAAEAITGQNLVVGESVPLSLPPPDFEFAVIAGNRTIDPVTSQVLENPDDGKVSVSDTKLDGMSDFREVGASHTFIMQKSDVIQLVDNFLRYGSFDRPY